MLWTLKTDSSLARCNGHYTFHCSLDSNIRIHNRNSYDVSGHYSRLGQEVMADNLNRVIGKPVTLLTLWLFSGLHQLSYVACDLLQTLVFTIAILRSARYSPRDQRVFYWVARVEYTSVGILALGSLLYTCLGPFYQGPSDGLAVLISISMVSVVLTTILLTASIRLQIKSNPEREESKVRPICFEC